MATYKTISKKKAQQLVGLEEVYRFENNLACPYERGAYAEISGYKGGDTLTYRIYRDGTICER